MNLPDVGHVTNFDHFLAFSLAAKPHRTYLDPDLQCKITTSTDRPFLCSSSAQLGVIRGLHLAASSKE